MRQYKSVKNNESSAAAIRNSYHKNHVVDIRNFNIIGNPPNDCYLEFKQVLATMKLVVSLNIAKECLSL